MPADQLGKAMAGLKQRRGSASELVRQAVLMLETASAMDSQLSDRLGAVLSILRGPAKPGGKPDAG